jgi:predicted HTH domain antitoxin
MPLLIDDDTLKQAGLTEQEARVEFACRLFQAGRLSKVATARLCSLDRVGFESELQKRSIDIFGYTAADLDADLATLDRVLGKS